MKRRTFFANSLAAVAAVGVFGIAVKPPRLVMYGDGIHDDTKALQAYFNGKDVFWAHKSDYQTPCGKVISISRKSFLLSETITFDCKTSPTVKAISNCFISVDDNAKGSAVFSSKGNFGNRAFLDGCIVDGRNVARCAYELQLV